MHLATLVPNWTDSYGSSDNLAGQNAVEKCPGHVDGGSAYCCDEEGGSKKCKCASSAFTIYASTTPIKTIAPQMTSSTKTHSTLLTSKATSVTSSTTRPSTSVTPGYHYNTHGPRSAPTAAVNNYVPDPKHVASGLPREGLPSLCLGGLAFLVVALLFSATLCLCRRRGTRVSDGSKARYDAVDEKWPLDHSTGEEERVAWKQTCPAT